LQTHDPRVGAGDFSRQAQAARGFDVGQNADVGCRWLLTFEALKVSDQLQDLLGAFDFGQVDDVQSVPNQRLEIGLVMHRILAVHPHHEGLVGVSQSGQKACQLTASIGFGALGDRVFQIETDAIGAGGQGFFEEFRARSWDEQFAAHGRLT
jgi:hypothetical protein